MQREDKLGVGRQKFLDLRRNIREVFNKISFWCYNTLKKKIWDATAQNYMYSSFMKFLQESIASFYKFLGP